MYAIRSYYAVQAIAPIPAGVALSPPGAIRTFSLPARAIRAGRRFVIRHLILTSPIGLCSFRTMRRWHEGVLIAMRSNLFSLLLYFSLAPGMVVAADNLVIARPAAQSETQSGFTRERT